MMSENGSAKTIAFRAPTLGEAIIEGAVLLVAVRCPCQQHLSVQSQLIHGQWMSLQGTCPRCQTPYGIQGLGLDAAGALHVQIAKGVPMPVAG